MFFILLAIVLVVILEIFMLKLYKDGGCQLEKYDKTNTVILSDSVDEFISKIKAVAGPEITQINSNGNKVELVYKNNAYEINVEDGKAAVEYDKAGCGIKLSRIGRVLRVFKFYKAANKAIEINAVMDCLAGKDKSEETQAYKKVKTDKNALVVFAITMIVCLFIGISGMTGNMQEEAIDNVKATVFYESVTYEELLNTYIVNPEWTAFNSENDIVIVEMNGTSIENDQVCIQFSGEMGMGFNGVGQQDFKLRYFDINGESLDPVGAMEYIYNYNPQ